MFDGHFRRYERYKISYLMIGPSVMPTSSMHAYTSYLCYNYFQSFNKDDKIQPIKRWNLNKRQASRCTIFTIPISSVNNDYLTTILLCSEGQQYPLGLRFGLDIIFTLEKWLVAKYKNY